MHIAPVVIVRHSDGPERWAEALRQIADALDAHPDLPLTLRAPGAALDQVWRSDPSLGDRLVGESVSWLAGGWSDPVLADLPPSDRDLQLAREQAAMGTAGITASGLWVGDGWEPALVSLAIESDLPLVFIDISLLPSSNGQPGAVERAGQVAIAVPVGTTPEPTGDDGLRSVVVEPADLVAFGTRHRGQLATADDYLAHHHPGPRLTPIVTSPPRSSDTEPFYRKLLLMATDRSDRKGSIEEILALQSREFVTGVGGGIPAHRRLVAARRRVERNRRRGDSWVTVEDVDWDADGIDEIQVETATASLIIDPTRGLIDSWDDKTRDWPILAVQPVMSAAICRRMAPDGTELPLEMLRLDRRAEGRSEAQLGLMGDGGGRYEVKITDTELTIEMSIPRGEALRIGPELPVSMDFRRARLRVDGGAWSDADTARVVSGHRFRLADDEHSLVVSGTRPTEMFVRPLPGHGLLIWPHWVTDGDATYTVSFAPA